MAGLPAGRGLRRGVDANINQNESFEFRRLVQSQAPSALVGTMISALDPISPRIDLAAGFSQSLRLFPFPALAQDYGVDRVRLRVRTASAAQNVRTALYALDTSGASTFVKVPNSEATFSTTATGLLTISLPDIATLKAGTAYYQGYRVSDAVIGVSGDINTLNRLWPTLVWLHGDTTLLSRLTRSTATESFTAYYPWIVYMSRQTEVVL